MSPGRVQRSPNPRDTARDAAKSTRKHDHVNCDRPPTDPDGLVGVYDRVEGHRLAPWRLRVRWDEVVTDSLGNAIRLRRYNLEWQSTKDFGAHWRDAGRARVPAKADTDDNSKDHFVIPKTYARWGYRFRVQAEAKNGCLSEWSGWLDVGSAVEVPPDVEELSLDIDEGKAHISWKMPDDDDDPQTHDVRIAYVRVQLFRDSIDNPDDVDGSANMVDQDRRHHGEHKMFKLHQPPGNHTYIARVFSVTNEGVRSNGVTTSATKNTPSQPAGPSISFDAMGPRHARFRGIVQIAEVSDTDFEISYYRVQWVDKRASGTPTSSDDREHRHVKAKGSNHEMFAVFRGVPAEHFTYARTQAVDKNGKESAWSSWTAGGKPTASDTVPDLTIVNYIVNRRRVGVKWDVPIINNIPDERIAHIHGQIATDNTFTTLVDEWHKHAGKGSHRYAIPVGDATLDFYVRLRTLDGAGNVGNWQPTATGHLLNPDGDTAGVDEVGTVKKWSGKIAHIPGGWLLCNGAAVSRVTYAELDALYASDGYPWGAGDGSTTFNIPDFRRRNPRGALDDSEVGGSEGLAVASRDPEHDVHGNHATHGAHAGHGAHNQHGGHITHGAHAGHGSHNVHNPTGTDQTDFGPSAHSHSFNTGTPSTNVVVQGGGGAAPAAQGHTHGGNTANSGSHQHRYDHSTRHDALSGALGHGEHAGHGSHSEHFAGEHDVGGGSGHTAHSDHGSHSEHGTGEHDADRPNNKGHRTHPHHKIHFIVRASS